MLDLSDYFTSLSVATSARFRLLNKHGESLSRYFVASKIEDVVHLHKIFTLLLIQVMLVYVSGDKNLRDLLPDLLVDTACLLDNISLSQYTFKFATLCPMPGGNTS